MGKDGGKCQIAFSSSSFSLSSIPPLPVSTLEGRPRQRGKEEIEEPENTVSPLPISQMKIEDLSACVPALWVSFFPSRCRGWVIWECDCCKFEIREKRSKPPPPCFEFCTRRPVVPPKQKAIQTTQKRVERAHPCLEQFCKKRKEKKRNLFRETNAVWSQNWSQPGSACSRIRTVTLPLTR